MQRPEFEPSVVLGESPLTIEELVGIARRERSLTLSRRPEFIARLDRGRALLCEQLVRGARIYGVTTGFGDSCENSIEAASTRALTQNLVRFHGCGTGRLLDDEEARATMVARLTSLATGYSAVRPLVLETLVRFLAEDLVPEIPSEGSVGASGDLTPLSYVAAALMGERRVRYRGETLPAAQALALSGIEPLVLEPKESLALMNGTSVMAGIACLAFSRAARVARLSASLTAMSVEVLGAEARHFDDRIFKAKPHPGQRAVARWVRGDLDYEARSFSEHSRVQERYSLRCAPHVIGVLVDSLPFLRTLLETELNGASDNPLVDLETGTLLHGGNFYGGHLCHAMDLLKTAVANLADLMDRQLILLTHPASSNGLPENLVGAPGPSRVAHHGFKAMQILTSALTAEALKLTMPASVFSRSTENHNQDKVSMGTIAARDCTRILELTETVGVVHLLALCQAVDLRGKENCRGRARVLHEQVRRLVPMNVEDRAMDGDISEVLRELRAQRLDLGVMDFSG